jgi:hypothetical protein
MKAHSFDSPISRTLRPLMGLFDQSCGHFSTLQAHSPQGCKNNSFSHYPKVAQRKQCFQLGRVFDQTPLPSLVIAKLEFHNPEEVFHFSPNAGLDLLQLLERRD